MGEFSVHSAKVAIEGYSVIICLLLAAYHCCHFDAYQEQKRWFIAMLLSNVGMMAGDLAVCFLTGVPGRLAGITVRLGLCGFYTCFGLLAFAMTGFLRCFLEPENAGSLVTWRFAGVLCGMQIIFSVLSLGNGMYFICTSDNFSAPGSWYPVSCMLPMMLCMAGTWLIWLERERVSLKTALFLAGCVLLLLTAVSWQSFCGGSVYVNGAATLVLILVNIHIQGEQEQAAKKAEKELADLHVDIMLSQIRPHFLYNSLAAIRQLCDRDTEQAKQSILDFSRFLRANMNSLTTREPIAFDRELEHARSYLNLEQQRFGKKLRVIYDINAHDFLVPTLTLQPIVENAVRHGVRRRKDGGTVKIHTEEWKDSNIIVVQDDGVGMEAAAESSADSSHIGIANVRRRVETQCGGTLTIRSDASGTMVILWLPKVF